MNYKEKIKKIIERDRLAHGSKRREYVYKKMVLAKILRSLEISHERVAAMFHVFTKNGYGDHSSSINWERKYDEYSIYPDFIKIESEYLKELNIRTDEELFEESLAKEVLGCDDYWQLVELKERIKTKMNNGGK